jgi:hypothetical protein
VIHIKPKRLVGLANMHGAGTGGSGSLVMGTKRSRRIERT